MLDVQQAGQELIMKYAKDRHVPVKSSFLYVQMTNNADRQTECMKCNEGEKTLVLILDKAMCIHLLVLRCCLLPLGTLLAEMES